MALFIGEHGWRVHERDATLERIGRMIGQPEPEVDHQSVRVRCGWGGDVAHIVVSTDVDGKPLISIGKQTKFKTKDMYRTVRGGPDIHNAEDFRRFMQVLIEAGQRAGFLD